MRTLLCVVFLSLVACNTGPLFFAELEEPRLCKTLPAVPFDGTQPGAELRRRLAIPVGQELPLFSIGDGGSSNVETEIRLIEFVLVRRSGIPDFNAVEAARIVVEPAPGRSTGPATLVTYTRDPGRLPGDTLIVGGGAGVNLVPYMFDPGTLDGGVPPSAGDGGTASQGTILVEAVMSGSLPEQPWRADVRVCIYMRTRFNYLNAYGL